jgi:hypothetical protein
MLCISGNEHEKDFSHPSCIYCPRCVLAVNFLGMKRCTLDPCDIIYYFPTSLMKMTLSSLNLVRKIGVCITSEENGVSKLTSEENLFNNLLH